MEQEKNKETSINLSELKEVLINHICLDNKAFFRHQQRNEEDIKPDEKKTIVIDILEKSHSRFLSRFGMALNKDHLKYFESQNYDDNQDKLYIKEQIKQLKFNLDHQRLLIKNRRYAAMLNLINKKEYFSDYEMSKRNPLLFEELVGRFLSSSEKAKRSRPNSHENTLVDVLLNQIDHEETMENMKKQQLLNQDEQSGDSFSDNESDMESKYDQWGNFDDDHAAVSKSRKRHANFFVTANERDMLRGEFLGIMYNEFLMGNDSEFFDYSQVDSNEELDEIMEKDQDYEDKYFEDNDNSSGDIRENGSKCNKDEVESEDELDIYMKHIEQHIRKQKEDAFQEEFDEDE